MEWVTKKDKMKKLYDSTDDVNIREITKFLFIPKKVDGVYKWLETVTIEQRLTRYYYGRSDNVGYYWKSLKFITKKEVK
jgi:hypothetical protein